jgi:hypothetical protein
MEHRYLIFGNTVSDYELNKTFPRDISNIDYVQFLKTVNEEGLSLIGGMYEDALVLGEKTLTLEPVPSWVQEDIDSIS